jgi:hypothetical protein
MMIKAAAPIGRRLFAAPFLFSSPALGNAL